MSDKEYALILAILQKEDYEETAAELTRSGIFMTRLSSRGGFMRRENVTIMIGVEKSRHDEVMAILKRTAGRREKAAYGMPSGAMDMYRVGAAGAHTQAESGGVTVFSLTLDGFTKL